MKKYINSLKEIEEKIGFNLLLNEIYNNKLTCKEIEKIFNIEQRFMSKLNKELNLGIKKSWSQTKEYYSSVGIEREKLYEMYIDEELSLRSISEYYNIHHQTVKGALLFFNICNEDEIRPFDYDGYYDSRRTSMVGEDDSRIYQTIVENYIGRDLNEDEVVHHIDKDRSNNDICNLFIFECERYHSLYHGYINSTNHDYISPQYFVDNVLPKYLETFLNEDWLYLHYIEKNESMEYISNLCDVSRGHIKTSLEQFDILKLKSKRVNQFK